MNVLFDKWTAAFGAPPALLSVPYDLPCHWTEIQNDVLDSQGGAAAAALNQSPAAVPSQSPSSASSAAGGAFAHSPVAASAASGGYANSYSQPPPPPPEYDDGASNPFADAAAEASRSPAAGGGGGGGSGEPPLFWAEALFDFELASDGGDITYVNFKAGDRIAVTQEGDEWWFGEVRGNQGFFPSNYTKRL